MALQRIKVNIVYAPDIDGCDLVAVTILTVRERLDAARAAELVLNNLIVEAVLSKRIFAFNKLELRFRNERE